LGRKTIKSKARKKIKVPYDAELNDLREWQDNMYNPGHYIGTGKVSYPLKNIARQPKLKWAFLAFYIIPAVIAFFFVESQWHMIGPGILILAVIVYIIWDSKRVINKKHKHKRKMRDGNER